MATSGGIAVKASRAERVKVAAFLVVLGLGVWWWWGAGSNERATTALLQDVFVRAELPVEPFNPFGYGERKIGSDRCDRYGFRNVQRGGESVPKSSAAILADSYEESGWEVARFVSTLGPVPAVDHTLIAISPTRGTRVRATFTGPGLDASVRHAESGCMFGDPENMLFDDFLLVDEFPP